jgi:hypothetical protein
MTGVVRTNADSHNGHAGYRVPYHKTSYASGSGNVFANNESVVRKGDSLACGDKAVGASSNVFANNIPVHRQGDPTSGHGNWVPNAAATGSANVFAN